MFSKLKLPKNSSKIGETPIMNEKNVFPEILNKHMTPKGKWAQIVVIKGILKYVHDNEPKKILQADKDHTIVIEPEKYHHVILDGIVEFKIEFYKISENIEKFDDKASRPGENFL